MWSRILWFLVVSISIVLTTLLIIRNVQGYLEYSPSVNVRKEIQTAPNNHFPVVSICNPNPVSTVASSEYIRQKLNKKFNLNATTFNQMDLALLAINVDILEEIKYIVYQTYAPDFNQTLRQSFGYDLETFIGFAQFYSADLNVSENFEWYYSRVYGDCFKFNSKPINGSYYTQDWEGEGLELDIFMGVSDQSSSIFYTGNYRGVVIQIDDKDFFPLFEDGIGALPGTFTTISFVKTDSQVLPAPYSKCVENDKVDTFMSREMKRLGIVYTYKNCADLLIALVQKDLIGCYSYVFPPILPNASRCESQESYLLMKGLNIKQYRNNYMHMCPFVCHTVTYDFVVSNIGFPNFEYFEHMRNDYGKYYQRLLQTKNVTFDMYKSSFGKVQIIIKEILYTQITEGPSKPSVDFFGEIGGSLSLFIGITFMAFIEIIDLLIKLIIVVFKYQFLKKTSVIKPEKSAVIGI